MSEKWNTSWDDEVAKERARQAAEEANKLPTSGSPCEPPIVDADIVSDHLPSSDFYPALMNTLDAHEARILHLSTSVEGILNVLQLSQTVFLTKEEAAGLVDKIDQSYAAIEKLCDDVSAVAHALQEIDTRLKKLEVHAGKVTAVLNAIRKPRTHDSAQPDQKPHE